MNTSRLFSCVGVSALFLCALVFFAPTHVAHAEQITSFDDTIFVAVDGRMTIEESIVYDFGTAQHHGIYRDIPDAFTDTSGKNHDLIFTVKSVTDEAGTAQKWEVQSRGNIYRIRIGDPTALVTSVHTYVVTYTVENAVVFLPDHDELYWNVTGTGWPLQIEKAHATVILPKDAGIKASDVTTACYQGMNGSKETCTTTGSGTGTEFSSRPLQPYEGMTVAVGFPKGSIDEPNLSTWEKINRWLKKHLDVLLALLIPLLIGFFSVRMWYKDGRDAKGTGVIVPEYEAPSNFSVLDAGFLLENTLDAKDISAAIIELAVKGALKIEEIEQEGFLGFKKKDYRLIKTTPTTPLLVSLQILYNELFDARTGAKGDTLLVSEVNTFGMQTAVEQIENHAGAVLAEQHLYTRDPRKLTHYRLLGTIPVLLLALFVLNMYLVVLFAWIGLGLATVFVIICMWLMPQTTKAGALAREKLLGLKRYIEVAEKDRIEFHNAPEKTPEHFEKLLPYAMLFGLTEIWVKEFAGIMKEPPQWYSSPSGTWAPIAFANDLNSFGTSFTSAATPSGGASGGGGFSGGGGGGGGGGSW